MWTKLVPRLAIATVLAILPSYLTETITEHYFLTSSPAFGAWSGDRMEIFIVSILLAAIAAGFIVGRLLPATGAYFLGVIILLSLFYVFCNPRVCYSTGIDGLEPLRMGYFFCCLGLVGVSIGNYGRTRSSPGRLAGATIGVAAFTGISFLPVIYTIAGVRLISPLDPWPLVILLVLLSFFLTARTSEIGGWELGMAVPLLGGTIVVALSIGIAREYFAMILPDLLLIASALVLGAAIGVVALRAWPRPVSRHIARSSKPFLALVALVLVMMVVILPDAVAGVVPQGGIPGPTSGYTFGPSVYAGGYMATGLMRTEGVSLTLTFSGTNSSAIQADNFLAAGIGVHAPGCCVDGIDYGYRFDVYLFHDGSEALVASAWQICDTNVACGGHSWKNLMLLHSEPVVAPSVSSDVHLAIEWKNRTVYWSYSMGDGPVQNFTSLAATSQENSDFDIGSLTGASLTQLQSGNYFFQFGLMSRYPPGHPGWSVNFECPAYLASGGWACVDHANSVQGDQSFWKALWRWGESYGNVAAVPDQASRSVAFSYSSSTMASFQTFW